MMSSRYTTQEVMVYLEEFSTEDLIEELRDRGIEIMGGLLETVWFKRRLGHDYQQDLDQLIYQVLGRLV